MSTCKWIRVLTTLFVMAFIVMIPVICAATDRIGIVLMHGKTGNPSFIANAAGGALQQAGFLVEAPEMPWSQRRYIDQPFGEALNEIEQAVERLRKEGANKIIIAGHSMGADAALAYAANRGGIDGVILLAPGHTPDSPSHLQEYQVDVAKAKAMMDSGDGDKFSTFDDWNRGIHYTRAMKASIYYSFFDPKGLGAMSIDATLINPNIPVLYVIGSQDPVQSDQGKSYAFNKLPENKLTKFMTVNADHMGTPAAAVSAVICWLNELNKQQ